MKAVHARSAKRIRRSATSKMMSKGSKRKKRTPPIDRNAIVRREPPTVSEVIENVLVQGDLTPLTATQRLEYYKAVCKSLGLNPLTRPFDYIAFRATDNAPAKLVLYARKDCTEQLRKIHGIAVTESDNKIEGDMCIVTVKTMDRHGRTDTGTGVVEIAGLKGKALANAIMKAETKAKRRATLSLAGLGFLDESEIDGLDNYGTMTPGGRLAFVTSKEPSASLEAATAARDADNAYLDAFKAKERAEMAKISGTPIPCLWYQLHEESQTYEITGDDTLKKAHRDLLAPLWNGGTKTIVAQPEQLGKLISQFEQREVPFRELKRP